MIGTRRAGPPRSAAGPRRRYPGQCANTPRREVEPAPYGRVAPRGGLGAVLLVAICLLPAAAWGQRAANREPQVTLADRVIRDVGLDQKLNAPVPLDLVWGHHPAFGPPFLDESCRIDLPGATVRTVDLGETGRCQPGEELTWPLILGRDGGTIDLSRMPSPAIGAHDLALLTDAVAYAGVSRVSAIHPDGRVEGEIRGA